MTDFYIRAGVTFPAADWIRLKNVYRDRGYGAHFRSRVADTLTDLGWTATDQLVADVAVHILEAVRIDERDRARRARDAADTSGT